VNTERGGIDIGGVTHKLRISYANDNSDGATAVNITQYMIDELHVDFILAPYSAVLTGAASAVTEDRKVIMAVGGAPSTSKFAGKNFLFGTLPSSNTYMRAALEVLAQKQVCTCLRLPELRVSAKNTLLMLCATPSQALLHPGKKLKVAYFTEDASFARGVCSGITSHAAGLGLQLHAIGLQTIRSAAKYSSAANDLARDREIGGLVQNLSATDADVVFGCTYYETCKKFIQQAKLAGYSPKVCTVLGTGQWSTTGGSCTYNH
jgi:ABC-type branched-subunit amino acid transport system substrate-binding protein